MIPMDLMAFISLCGYAKPIIQATSHRLSNLPQCWLLLVQPRCFDQTVVLIVSLPSSPPTASWVWFASPCLPLR